MAILKARENSSDTFTPVAMMGVGNASQSQRGLMTAQDKVMLDSIGDVPSSETDTLWDKVENLSTYEEVQYTDYFTFNNTVTNIAEAHCYKLGKMLIFNFDLRLTQTSAYQINIGTFKTTLKCTGFCAGRVSNSNFSVTAPATLIFISNGDIRVHCAESNSWVATAFTGVLFLQ